MQSSPERCCAICLEDLDTAEPPVRELSCMHAKGFMHGQCADTWFEQSSRCPVCNMPSPVLMAAITPADAVQRDTDRLLDQADYSMYDGDAIREALRCAQQDMASLASGHPMRTAHQEHVATLQLALRMHDTTRRTDAFCTCVVC